MAAISANVDESGTLPAYRSFEQQKAKREGQVAKLQAQATRSQEEEAILLDYQRQIEGLPLEQCRPHEFRPEDLTPIRTHIRTVYGPYMGPYNDANRKTSLQEEL